MKLIRKLDWYGVRDCCIKNELYTNGCNEEYNNLSDYVYNHNIINDEDLIYIATDILEHSITDMTLEDIVSALNRRSHIEVRSC